MFPLFRKIDHKHMALAVREFGPPLFQRLLKVKNSEPLKKLNSLHDTVDLMRPIDRTKVLEWRDLCEAIDSGAHSGQELILLQYWRSSIRRIGRFAGMAHIVCGHHGGSTGYYVISAEDVSTYDGSFKQPQPAGSLLGCIIAGLYFGLCSFFILETGAWALAQWVQWQSLFPLLALAGAAGAYAFTSWQVKNVYELDSERKLDDQLKQSQLELFPA